MNNTLTSSNAMPVSTVSNRPLWAAIGVLGVCVVTMGATLVHVNQRPQTLAQASIPLGSARAMPQQLAALSSPGMLTERADGTPVTEPARPAKSNASVNPERAPPSESKRVAVKQPSPAARTERTASATTGASSGEPAVAQATVKPVCAACGTVESVTPFTREGQGSGVGVITGGVLGGVVGNQVGKGNGRAVATVLGAVGGGWAGNTIEKNMKKTTAYNVRVRMQDGSSRTIEQSSAPMVGSQVILDGQVMRPA